MGYRFTDLPYLAERMPDELRFTIMRLTREHDGNLSHVAEALGVARTVLYRYIRRLNLRPEIDGIRDELSRGRIQATRERRRLPGRGRLSEFERTAAERPDTARQMLLWAFKDAGADYRAAALQLGIGKPRLMALMVQLGMQSELRDFAAEVSAARVAAGRATFASGAL